MFISFVSPAFSLSGIPLSASSYFFRCSISLFPSSAVDDADDAACRASDAADDAEKAALWACCAFSFAFADEVSACRAAERACAADARQAVSSS